MKLNLTKQMQDLCTENYISLMKEIRENIKKWTETPCSLVGRLNIGRDINFL